MGSTVGIRAYDIISSRSVLWLTETRSFSRPNRGDTSFYVFVYLWWWCTISSLRSFLIAGADLPSIASILSFCSAWIEKGEANESVVFIFHLQTVQFIFVMGRS